MSTEQICSTFPEIDKGGKGEMIDRQDQRQSPSREKRKNKECKRKKIAKGGGRLQNKEENRRVLSNTNTYDLVQGRGGLVTYCIVERQVVSGTMEKNRITIHMLRSCPIFIF